MRWTLLIVSAALFATPARAQTADPDMQVPQELLDPAWADRVTDALQVLSRSMLELPVGEVQAAVEGRTPNAADRRKTIGSETRLNEREMQQQIEAARPQMRAAMKAVSAALPAMIKGLREAGREMEKAAANLPQPGYPKR